MNKNLIVVAIISSLSFPLVGCDNHDNPLTKDQAFARQQKLDEYQHEERMQLLKNKQQTAYQNNNAQQNYDIERTDDQPRPPSVSESDQNQPQYQGSNDQYDDELMQGASPATQTTQTTDNGFGVGSMITGAAAGAVVGGLATHLLSKKTPDQQQAINPSQKTLKTNVSEKAKRVVDKTKKLGSTVSAHARNFGSSVRSKYNQHRPTVARHSTRALGSLSSHTKRAARNFRAVSHKVKRRFR